MQQVIHVPLQLFNTAPNAGRTCDQAHATRHFELIHRLAQFLAVFALDAPANPTPPRVIGHQNQIPAGQGKECGEGCPFVAAFLLFNLNQQFLAFADRFLDGGATFNAGLEILLGDFLEWQKAVPLFAIGDKTGFETGFNPSHDAFVNIGLPGFPTR